MKAYDLRHYDQARATDQGLLTTRFCLLKHLAARVRDQLNTVWAGIDKCLGPLGHDNDHR